MPSNHREEPPGSPPVALVAKPFTDSTRTTITAVSEVPVSSLPGVSSSKSHEGIEVSRTKSIVLSNDDISDINPFTPRPGHRLIWKNIDMTVANKKSTGNTKPLHVLKGISGAAEPKQLLCILGHSGSGTSVCLMFSTANRFGAPLSCFPGIADQRSLL